jgi:hypothetical protein
VEYDCRVRMNFKKLCSFVNKPGRHNKQANYCMWTLAAYDGIVGTVVHLILECGQ